MTEGLLLVGMMIHMQAPLFLTSLDLRACWLSSPPHIPALSTDGRCFDCLCTALAVSVKLLLCFAHKSLECTGSPV